MESQHKLHYFDMKGRAEVSRILLYFAGIKFEDIRHELSKFAEEKDQFKNKQFPILFIDGVQYCQSRAIMQYAAEVAQMWPKDPLQIMGQVEIIGLVDDLIEFLISFLFGGEAKKEANKAKCFSEGKRFEEIWETIQKRNGTKFIASNTLGTGDLCVYNCLNMFVDIMKYQPTDFGQKLLNLVNEDYRIRAYTKGF